MSPTTDLRILVFTLGLVACTSSRPFDAPDLRTGDPDMGQEGGGTPDGDTPGAAVAGTSMGVYITEGAAVTRPDDTSKLRIAALHPGSAMPYPAQGSANGTFTIPGVPAGPLWIRQGTDRFIHTSGRTLDLSHYHLGRPNRVEAMEATAVSLALTGLLPWTDDDDLLVVAPNVGLYDSLVPYLNPMLTAGATALMGASFDWTDLASPWLLDPAQGDRLYVAQLSWQMAMGVSYIALSRAAVLPQLSVKDGDAVALNVMLSDMAPAHSLQVSWKRSAFEALRQAIHPAAQAFSQAIRVNANPGGDRVDLADLPDLLQVQPATGTTDLMLGALSFRNPFPTSFSLYARFTHLFRVSYMIPGAEMPATLLGTLEVSDTLARMGSGPVQPLVGPVTDLKINGKGVHDSPTGVGVTPILTWGAPAVGAPNGYILTIYNFVAVPGLRFPRQTRVATLYTGERSVTVPQGLLEAGKLYVFHVRAVSQPGVDLVQAPYKTPPARAVADVLTSIITP